MNDGARVWRTACLLLTLGLLAASGRCVGQRSLAQEVRDGSAPGLDFDREVAPLLARRCLDCHSGTDPRGGLRLNDRDAAFTGGDQGPAVVAGNLDESLLWEQVSSDAMPPKQPLSAEEKETLRRWIESGAAWGTNPIDPFQASTERRAGRDWWSLQPLARPEPNAEAPPTGWCRGPIDAWVESARAAHGLDPASEADRLTLIRRLAFNLTGLPPAPEQVDAFLADERPTAYERLVDRLLASPQFGVHQARRWLDLARFGESNGFEYDEFRPNAWRYRDWVVDALNADMPYDQFARLQLAGDALEPGNPAAVEATGFLAAAAYDTAGQNQVSTAMRAVVRQDELEDLIATTSQTFLGLTIHCARCHDHKFDPITQAEYYRVAAALAGVSQGERDLSAIDTTRAHLAEELRRAEARLEAIERPIRAEIQTERGTGPILAGPDDGWAWDFTGEGSISSEQKLPIHLQQGAVLGSDGLRLGGASGGYASTEPLPRPVGPHTLEAWVRLDRLDQAGGAAISLERLDGSGFDAIVYAERDRKRWMAGSEFYRRTLPLQAAEEQEAASRVVHLAVTYTSDGLVSAYRDGVPLGEPYQTTPAPEFAAGGSRVLFGLRHSPAGPGKLLDATLVRARLRERALSTEEVAQSFATQGAILSRSEIARHVRAADRDAWEQARGDIERLRHSLAGLKPLRAYAVISKPTAQTHILIRGNPGQPGKLVTPGGVAAIAGLSADFALPGDAADADRRIELARWISHPANPLFSRVISNRIWQSHFGSGLVETPSDFGFNGGRASHPELLDSLATELIERGWSQKELHRSIVLSATYRQSGTIRPQAMAADAGNRWLWRHEPTRLEAETVRDAMLVAADRLNLRLGGPSFQDYALTPVEGTASVHYLPVDPDSPQLERRTLYRSWTRGGRSAFLDVLDCPDPSTTAPLRNVTTTPLQALTLMNNALVLHLAETLGQRLAREAGSSPDQQAERAYRLVLGRAPNPEEREAAAAAIRAHGPAVLARALFNSNAFLYVD